MAEMTCHVCGYDMTDRAEGDLCPECGHPLDPRFEIKIPRLMLFRIWVVLLVLAAIVMPFVALLSLLLTVPTYSVRLLDQSRYGRRRVPDWVAVRVRIIRGLWLILIGEFIILMVVSTIDPQALNWW